MRSVIVVHRPIVYKPPTGIPQCRRTQRIATRHSSENRNSKSNQCCMKRGITMGAAVLHIHCIVSIYDMIVANERRNETVHNCCEARPSTSTRDGGVTLIWLTDLRRLFHMTQLTNQYWSGVLKIQSRFFSATCRSGVNSIKRAFPHTWQTQQTFWISV